MTLTELAFYTIIIAVIINIILAFVLVFLERRNPAVTWAWILVLMFVPGLGFILYLFLGQDMRKKKLFSSKIESDLSKIVIQQEILQDACESTSYNNILHLNDKVRYASNDVQHSPIEKDRDIIHLFIRNARSVYTNNNKATILNNGAEKFPCLIESLEDARDHIHSESGR